VVVAIKEHDAVPAKVRELGRRHGAAGVRGRGGDHTDTPFGRRAVGWEPKGVPVRVEVAP